MLSRPTSGGQGTDELLKQRITCWLIKHQSAKREALKKQQTNRKKKTKKKTFLYSSSFHSIEVYRQECFFVFCFFLFRHFLLNSLLKEKDGRLGRREIALYFIVFFHSSFSRQTRAAGRPQECPPPPGCASLPFSHFTK